MLQAYSTNLAVAADTAIPFNNVYIDKGCGEDIVGTSTIQLNKRGVYMVEVDGVAAAATTIQLSVDGVLQPQAQSSGTTVSFMTLVQVNKDNTKCCCSSPTNIQVNNTTAATFDNVNIVVTKLC